jgi:AraC-like DNA-binding protein
LPTAGGGIARAAYSRALNAGLDVKPLLQNVGLTHRQIKTRDLRIPVSRQVNFLNEVSDAIQDDFLGIHLAQSVDLRELGLVYYVLASSENLANALARLARYSSVNNEGVHIAFTQRGHPVLSFEYVGVPRTKDRHQIEFFVAFLLRLCRRLTGRHIVPLRVLLAHRRGRTPRDLRVFFGCEVEFGASADQVIFPHDVRNIVMMNADPYLNSLLERYCQELLLRRRAKMGDWTSRVENIVAPLLPHGEATIDSIAQRLGLSSRTLTRRLHQEGVSFAKLLQNLRLQLARQYLRESDISVTQVAWLLGYREPSSFNHAFKRWTGKPPRRVRHQAMQ